MRIVFYSKCGAGLGVAMRCQQEGNQVWMYYGDKEYAEIGKGYIENLKNITEIITKKPDFVVFDMVGYAEDAKLLNKYGIKTLFSDPMADKLALQPGLGAQLAKNVGIKVPDFKEFNGLDEVQKHILGEPGPYILKPHDNIGPEFTLVSKSDDELMAYADWLKEMYPDYAGRKFTLQRVMRGAEVSTEVWFQNGKPVFPGNSTMETTHFLAGDVGPQAGCQTSLVWGYAKKEPRLIQEHKKVWMLLEKIDYTGPWGMDCIVDGKTVNFIRWTPQMCCNTIYGLLELFTGEVSKFLSDLNQGILKEVPVRQEMGYAVNVSVPPYPNKDRAKLHKAEGLPVIFDKNDEKHIWFQDMKMGRTGPVVAGTKGLVMVATTASSTLDGCEKGMNKLLGKIRIPDMQYRIDGVRAVRRDYELLKSAGYF